ncbi:MAG: CoA pyrophosphatase [Marinicella sp.]|nr:CoA pyrophosphatase [Xanthomonadales bacterium]
MKEFSKTVKPYLNQDLIDERLWQGSPGEMERAAAVLFPFYWKQDEPWVLLTQRNRDLRHHSGQVSFPGGGYEQQDKNIKHTAYRETFEEIGIPRKHIKLWGFLDGVTSISGFHVTPFVGEISDLSHLSIDKNEVDRAFGVPFAFFEDINNRVKHKVQTPLGERHYYVFDYQGDVIWGLTAQIIVQLVDRINKNNHER